MASTFDDDWLDGLSDFNGDFDPVMVGLVIMFWPMLAVILPIIGYFILGILWVFYCIVYAPNEMGFGGYASEQRDGNVKMFSTTLPTGCQIGRAHV